MKTRKLNADDIRTIMEALGKANQTELHDYFRRLLDSVYVEGNKRVTFEP